MLEPQSYTNSYGREREEACTFPSDDTAQPNRLLFAQHDAAVLCCQLRRQASEKYLAVLAVGKMPAISKKAVPVNIYSLNPSSK